MQSMRAAAIGVATLAATGVFPSDVIAQTGIFGDRVQIGARFHWFVLQDKRRYDAWGDLENGNIRGNFIGSVWGLDAIQDSFPRLHAQVAILSWAGIGASYDSVRARTLDWGNESKTVITSDGDVHAYGPLLYLFARWPNRTRFTPRVEYGRIWYNASFDTNPSWAATAPGYRFEVDDTQGEYVALGCDVRLVDRWSLDVVWRKQYGADVAARAYFTPGPRVGRAGSFPLECRMVGIGVAYTF